jgi:chaperone modulatory protein CbpM
VTGLSIQPLNELIEIGVIAPGNANARPMYFPPRYIVVASMASRLRDDFELDRHGVTLAMSLIKRIEELEMELNAVRARCAHSTSNPR